MCRSKSARDGAQRATMEDPEEPTPAERRAAIIWAQRLKRVFGIDIETRSGCGGAVRIIAYTQDPVIIEKTLSHLDKKGTVTEAPRWPAQRGKVRQRMGGWTDSGAGMPLRGD